MQTLPGAKGPLRFFQLILQEDLLGGWTLIRQWGQTGARGSHRQQHFDSRCAAQQALIEGRDQQLAKGYTVMFIHGAKSS